MREYDGLDLLDSSGETVGTIERTYVDDSGAIRYLDVKWGGLIPHHRLVPASGLQETDGGIQVPYDRATLEESPSIDTGDTLEGGDLDRVNEYYGSITDAQADALDDQDISSKDDEDSDGEPDGETKPMPVLDASEIEQYEHAPADGDQPIGQVRDLGDVIEVPIVEEVLVKQKVVREVLRVRKTWVTDSQTVSADLRHEGAELVSADEGINVRGTEHLDNENDANEQ